LVWNLLTNAIKFTPAGGRVHVRLERAESAALLTVSDSGPGISPEFLPHAFERFGRPTRARRARKAASGSGSTSSAT